MTLPAKEWIGVDVLDRRVLVTKKEYSYRFIVDEVGVFRTFSRLTVISRHVTLTLGNRVRDKP